MALNSALIAHHTAETFFFLSAISCQVEINPRCFQGLGTSDKRLRRERMDGPFPAIIIIFMFHNDHTVSLSRSTASPPFIITQVSSDGCKYPDHTVHPATTHSGASTGLLLVMSK